MGEPQHANHAVQETRCLAELGERGLTAWARRLEETDEVEQHINGRLERSNATHRFPQPSQSRPGDSLRLLCAEWAEHRMPLPDVLARLEAMVVAATASSSEAEVEVEARVCIICEEAPREVRFACGHALVCNGCLPVVVAQYKKCPTCDRPFGAQPVAERGRHVRGAPTFVLPK